MALSVADFDDGNSVPLMRFGTGQFPVAVTTGDLNGDGQPDILTVNQRGNAIRVLLHR